MEKGKAKAKPIPNPDRDLFFFLLGVWVVRFLEKTLLLH